MTSKDTVHQTRKQVLLAMVCIMVVERGMDDDEIDRFCNGVKRVYPEMATKRPYWLSKETEYGDTDDVTPPEK